MLLGGRLLRRVCGSLLGDQQADAAGSKAAGHNTHLEMHLFKFFKLGIRAGMFGALAFIGSLCSGLWSAVSAF